MGYGAQDANRTHEGHMKGTKWEGHFMREQSHSKQALRQSGMFVVIPARQQVLVWSLLQ